MRRSQLVVLTVLGFSLGGCMHNGFNPAIANALSNEERLALQSAMAEMLNSPNVVIAQDAFQQNHILVLAPAMANTPAGAIATGRMVDPDIFHLLTNGRECMLQHTKSGDRAPVMINCQAYQP